MSYALGFSFLVMPTGDLGTRPNSGSNIGDNGGYQKHSASVVAKATGLLPCQSLFNILQAA